MRDIPVIFSAPMVLALLREIKKPGTGKTMTRRLAWRPVQDKLAGRMIEVPTSWQKVEPGDRLWVRENLTKSQAGWLYSADDRLIEMAPKDPRVPAMIAWAHHKEQDYAPSIHMPRWASRIALVVKAKRIEPLDEISEEDALAEGIERMAEPVMGCYFRDPTHEVGSYVPTATMAFEFLWRDLHGDDAWNDDEVVAISFDVVGENVEKLARAA